MDNRINFIEDINRMFEERSCLEAQLEAVERDLIKQLRACGFFGRHNFECNRLLQKCRFGFGLPRNVSPNKGSFFFILD